ncbi:MAG: threonine synthase [Candidatus Hadarchaeales archaeon]
MRLECISCGSSFSIAERFYTCPKCEGLLEVEMDVNEIKKKLDRVQLETAPPSVWKYRAFMPVLDDSKIVTLGEGGTPLYRCRRLAKEIGIENLYIKFEGANPTGSFKDRGMTVGITKALEFGARTVACASTGNTSASLAAYAAKAGLRCFVILPKGKVALGKLTQTMIFGAKVLEITGNFDKALALVKEICMKHKEIYLLNSLNPFRLQGQKSIGFEIADQLGWKTPDRVIVPMGNCANIWAIYKGFLEMKMVGLTKRVPRMMGVQASGAMPIVNAIKEGRMDFTPVKNPETIATAIRIGNPVNGIKAIRAIKESKGNAEAVTDEEIIRAQKMIARLEGIGVEPASAASVAGIMKFLRSGEISREETVVCVATGHLLKDPEVAIDISEKPIEIRGQVEELERLVK